MNLCDLLDPQPKKSSHRDIGFLTNHLVKPDRTVCVEVQQLDRKIQQVISLSKEVSFTQYQLEQYRDDLYIVKEDVKNTTARLEEIVASLEDHHNHDLSRIESRIDEQLKNNAFIFTNIEDRINALEAHKQRWAYRAKGAWMVFALVAFILQYIGMQYVDRFLADRAELHSAVERLTNDVSHLSVQQQIMENTHVRRR